MDDAAPAVITAFRRATDEEWDLEWELDPARTYFQSRSWANLWERYRSVVASPIAVDFSDGMRAVVPAVIERFAFGTLERTRIPAGDGYGGFLSRGPLTSSHVDALVDRLSTTAGNLLWTSNPFQSAVREGTGTKTYTQAIDLAEGFEEASRRFNRGHRSAVNLARRSGVVATLDGGEEHWEAYRALYRQSLGRWGGRATSRHGMSLFDQLARTPGVRLWLARVGSKPVAGAVILAAANHHAYWLGATAREAFPLRASNLLLHEAARAAAGEGAFWFDLGASGGHSGVERFKRHFGPKVLPIHIIQRESAPLRLARRGAALVRQARGSG